MRWSAALFTLSLAAASGAALAASSGCGTPGLGLSGNGDGSTGVDASMSTKADGSARHDSSLFGGDSTTILGGGDAADGGFSGQCVPKTCTVLGVNCGPQGDGCGGVVQCGNCTPPQTCGGGGTASECGGNNNCKPKTCTDLGLNCGPVGDGCGNIIQCGSCTAPQTCGGGGDEGGVAAKPSVCGGDTGCNPQTCTGAGVNCGPIGDGCGNVVQCGNCDTPEICGGNGKPGVCGDGLVDAGDSGSKCVPKTCLSQNINCGPAGDGCGKLLSCGTCTAPQTCGGGATPGKCGGSGGCTPTTCTALGLNCGPAGDGCGGELQCGTCAAPQTCGGGGVPSVCGGSNDCVPKTCAALGLNCGAAGDGCGGLLQCGTTCPSGQICGGGGTGGVCGPTTITTPCTNLCLQQVACPGSNITTTITGTVYAPNGKDPIYDALVYIPNSAVAAFAPGVACETCTASVSGSPLVSTNTAPDGTFQLQNVPVGTNIPMVIQLGRWRRQITIPTVAKCANTPLPATLTSLPNCRVGDATCLTSACPACPATRVTGDIPLMGFVSGTADPLECVLRKIGIADSEFTIPSGGGRVQWYTGNGSTITGAPGEATLESTQATINDYDMAIFSCEGGEYDKSSTLQNIVIDYANAGGRVFATHFSYVWLFNDAPFSGTATWDAQQAYPNDPTGAFVDFTNPRGQAFAQWLQIVGASTTYGQVSISAPRHDFNAVTTTEAQQWLYWKPTAGTTNPFHYTFNTPVIAGAENPNACGRVLFSDFHVDSTTGGGGTFPTECDTNAMTAQEHLLEFMLFDLASCITPQVPPPPPTCTPETCMSQGFNCGPAGDGCGNQLACGTCVAPQTCGGGGKPGVCGGTTCAATTCTSQGIQCGPAGDGCGNLLECGNCPNGTTCGGGGVPGKCGNVTSCTPITCASQGIGCGPAGDGCGNLLECGNCPTGEACGGLGQPGKCGAPDASACSPLTCAEQKIGCGPAGNGCGGQLSCGPCVAPQTCGGGGVPSMCGVNQCTPTTCAALGYTCGPAGDGCGGQLACGTCPPNETCGGGGTPGVCGSPCMPATCASLKLGCGPAGDGCGGLLQCGTCTTPNTCGGGGVSGQCGNSGPK